MSKKVLGFHISPHELRHSSVTFYVQKFGLQDIAGFYYRFGWAFGSPEAKPYIDEHLLGGQKQQEKIIKTIEFDQFEKLREEMSILQKKNAIALEGFERVEFQLKFVVEAMKKGEKIVVLPKGFFKD